jgi:hypothetical protein
MPKDNQTLAVKLNQRRLILKELLASGEREIRVLECYGGFGFIYGRVYRGVRATGLVLEYNHAKAKHLASQRDTDRGPDGKGGWIVVQARTEMAIGAGIGKWIPFNILDCDPHGSPWDAIGAYFKKPRAHGPVLYVVVTDGLPVLKTKVEPSRINVLMPYVRKYGEMTVRANYAAIAKELFIDMASKAHWRCENFDFQQRPNEVAHWSAKLTWDPTLNPVTAPVKEKKR